MRVNLAEARHALLSAVIPLPADVVPLAEAAGRIVVEGVAARVLLPPVDCAAVDGYAVRVADVAGCGTSGLRLAGTVTAGSGVLPPLPRVHTVAVMTGAAVPSGVDAVVPHEAARREGDAILIPTVPAAGVGLRRAGSEARPGEVLLASGTQADPRVLERLAGQGISRISVVRRALVHLIATGDELVPPGEEPGPGRRVASNLPMLEALVRACGGEVGQRLVAPDAPDALRQVLGVALVGDLVITTGGTLRGSKDLTKAVLADLGAAFVFDGVAMRPGSSCALASAGKAMVLCLPGSPGAAFLGFAALARPLLRALHGWSQPVPTFSARLAEPLEPTPDVTRLVAGVVVDTSHGLEFRRGGPGWPALGMLVPSRERGHRDPGIAVELLPQG